ncbi:hypothetical protein GALMADRAFT_233811 [Galerina marginata CBS 339.88]|uniref:SEC7 domain-containing protein n=1 Tax=Galerina marginata (strain CBS 339.88) TaxID=685588 RepID=A0A067TYS5_GALM3|nr:hypothetical protein GALMADRAFT_233811 [Galerina marginata CBS 339.88]
MSRQSVEANAPPPYHKSSSSPLLLAETTTTRTEIVTTTTTETTTHLFSLPHWRKRNGTPSPVAQRDDVRDPTAPQLSRPSKSPSSALLVDKALPPTPPSELEDPEHATTVPDPPKSTIFSPTVSLPELKLPRPRKASAGPQSTAALAQAALGIGLPHASTSFSRPETSTIPFGPSLSPLSSSFVSTPSGVRRVKSLHRVEKRRTSEDHENAVNGEERALERRKRGLSFGTNSFLNIGNSDVKGKGRESETPSEPKAVPKPLSRKTSFWNRKKEIHPPEVTPIPIAVEDDSTLSLPPLPPLHQISPFEISEFPNVSPPIFQQAKPQHPRELSRSHSESAKFSRMTIPSLNITEISAPLLPPSSPPQVTPFPGETLAPLQPNGRPPSRPHRQPSTPLLHRLSLGVFASGEVSPTPGVLSSGHSQPLSGHTTQQLPRKQDTPIPKPLTGEDESPEIYLSRLKLAVSKAEVAGILASSSDSFYARALQAYINQFDFIDIPLDVALRKLLMEVGLPRETQQIDRVMEAFASRYMQCNSNIFTSDDHPYILAFSLIMLHTDAFNPSNKRKMTKPDYIKNTKLPGIPTEVLECFFDNIVFAPFIFIEDPMDFNGQPGLLPDVTRSMTINTPTSAMSPSAFKKVDPYYLITNHLLEPLRVDVNAYISLENPFSYEGTNGPWDEQEVHEAFVNAGVIEIYTPAVNRTPPMFNRITNGKSGSFIASGGGDLFDLSRPKVEAWNLKLTKVGLLNRKDDVLEGGRKSSNRKWKAWSVVLTGSQLLFFRDLTWAPALSHSSISPSECVVPPPTSEFRPDESFSVKDAIAVYDRSYTKYNFTMKFVLPDGRQILLQATGEKDLNEWISRINYASSFKSAGVRMRSPGLSGEDILLTGVAAATSHLHDMQKHPDVPCPRSWDSNAAHDLMDMLSGPPTSSPVRKRRVTMIGGNADFDLDAPVAPEVEGADEFKATFDRVKADLAAASWPTHDSEVWLPEEDSVSDIYDSPLTSPRSFDSSNSRLPSRSQIIQSKIRDLDSKISASQSQLDSDMRLIRNIAILTPFQKSSRSRLSTTLQNMAKRVSQLRLDLAKLNCHRVVLRSDLSSEGRSWNKSKQVALRVAKETLQTRRTHAAPKMTLSPLDSPTPLTVESLSNLPRTPASRPDSSASDSFHSATEFGFGWPSSEDLAFLTRRYESPKLDLSSSISSLPSESKSNGTRQRSLSISSHSHHLHSDRDGVTNAGSDDHGDEFAEEWNRTRCAQRVSLVRVPSDIKILTRFKGSGGS